MGDDFSIAYQPGYLSLGIPEIPNYFTDSKATLDLGKESCHPLKQHPTWPQRSFGRPAIAIISALPRKVIEQSRC
ncbi:hypothetical protein [Nitrosospira sp. NpAV]|uniref:hypothetical protein n=1 Tax=Nitrosospira sp. NpAV TaxID=58133 RepID=UPI0012EB8642|nr:hypothetical protein [Nitrosospira sp. NpAV]